MFETIFGVIISIIATWLFSRHYFLKGIRSAEVKEVTYRVKTEPIEKMGISPELSSFMESEAFVAFSKKMKEILKLRGMTISDLYKIKSKRELSKIGMALEEGTKEELKGIVRELQYLRILFGDNSKRTDFKRFWQI